MGIDYGQVSTKTMAANIFKSIKGKPAAKCVAIIEDALNKFGFMLSDYMLKGLLKEYDINRKL